MGLFNGKFRNDYSSNYHHIQYKQYLTGSDSGSHPPLGFHVKRGERATWEQIGPTGFSLGPRSMCDWEQYLNLPIAMAATALENGFMPEMFLYSYPWVKAVTSASPWQELCCSYEWHISGHRMGFTFPRAQWHPTQYQLIPKMFRYSPVPHVSVFLTWF